MSTIPKPAVVAPTSSIYADEPVLTIAKVYKIIDVLAVVATSLGFTVTQHVLNNAYEWVNVAWPLALIAWGLWSRWHQAQDTRSAVFSPATVVKLLEEAKTSMEAITPVSVPVVPVVTVQSPETPPVPVTPDVATP